MKEITFSVDYTARDYYLANKLHHTNTLVMIIMYAVGIFSLLNGLMLLFESSILWAIPLLLIAFFCLTFKHLYLRYISNKLFAGSDLKTTNYFKIGDPGVENRYTNGNSTHTWSEILKMRHDKEIFLLYIALNKFFIVPKRAVQESDWEELIEREKIHAKH